MTFRLQFASHLGFPTTDSPLFAALLCAADPAAHIEFAASKGFHGIQDPFAVSRPDAVQARIGRAIKENGLRAGCFVYTAMARLFELPWGSGDPAIERAIEVDIANAFEVGARLGATQIAILSPKSGDSPLPEQRHRMTDLLRRMGLRAADAGFILCVESVSAKRLPTMLLHHIADAAAIVRETEQPSVRLIFDTAHTAAMDGDPAVAFDGLCDLVDIVQLADNPGRVELGAGTIDFDAFLRRVLACGYTGLLELEHGWTDPVAALQEEYLDRLAALDARVYPVIDREH